MDIVAEIRALLADDWIGAIYREKIRTQRTRSIHLDINTRENLADIQYTLMGIELKVSNKRFPCPDLASARYMRVFARTGCQDFAIPYDITRISGAADELEISWQRCLLLLNEKLSDRPSRSVAQGRARLIKSMRTEFEEIGPGDTMPVFDRETRQKDR